MWQYCFRCPTWHMVQPRSCSLQMMPCVLQSNILMYARLLYESRHQWHCVILITNTQGATSAPCSTGNWHKVQQSPCVLYSNHTRHFISIFLLRTGIFLVLCIPQPSPQRHVSYCHTIHDSAGSIFPTSNRYIWENWRHLSDATNPVEVIKENVAFPRGLKLAGTNNQLDYTLWPSLVKKANYDM